MKCIRQLQYAYLLRSQSPSHSRVTVHSINKMAPVTRHAARLVKALQYRPVVVRRGHPATTKVFNNVEMLIMIVGNLPHFHLTRCERVHPVWKEIIRTSPELQEKRFLKPKTNYETVVFPNLLSSSRNSIPHNACIYYGPPRHMVTFTVCDLHPALTAIHNSALFFGVRAETILSWKVPGPWQNQFITQPPFPVSEELFVMDKCMRLELMVWDLASFYLQGGVIRDDNNFKQFSGSRKGVVTLGDLRKWVEDETINDSKAEIAERRFFISARLWQEERSAIVVYSRMIECGDVVMGTMGSHQAWEKVMGGSYNPAPSAMERV